MLCALGGLLSKFSFEIYKFVSGFGIEVDLIQKTLINDNDDDN